MTSTPHIVKVSIDIREEELIKAMESYKTPGTEGWYIVPERLDVGAIAFQIETTEISYRTVNKLSRERFCKPDF